MSSPAATTVGAALAAARQQLAAAGIDSAGLDATLLLAHLLGWSRAQLLAYPETGLNSSTLANYRRLLARRAAGEPLAYLTGQREFRGLSLVVDRRVLVPRPETELLVQLASERAHHHATTHLAVDVGTGSGAIAIGLAVALPSWRVIASDCERDALAVARLNVDRHGLAGRVSLVCASLLDWLGQPVELIVANLPYLRPDQANPTIAHEPANALYAGPDGFALYRRLLAQVPARLRPGGWLLAEIDPSQADLARRTTAQLAPDWPCSVQPDYAGHPRILLWRRP